jgi:glycogen synthase
VATIALRIALISYEFPPDTAVGGIGTYALHVSRMLAAAGHEIEVFSGSTYRQCAGIEKGVTVHRVHSSRSEFPERISHVFGRRHAEVGFELLEGPEFQAEAAQASARLPEIPLVVKLHTPTLLSDELNEARFISAKKTLGRVYRRLSWTARSLGGGPRMRHHALKGESSFADESERNHALRADCVTSPSAALLARQIAKWDLDPRRARVVPNAYAPEDRLLNIPVEGEHGVVAFHGRLEPRKGVMELADAIPLVLRERPKTRFRFVGQIHPYEVLRKRILSKAGTLKDKISFTGKVPLESVPDYLASTDVLVIPSRWENFPNVCLEAMAAGRAIIATRAGGLPELLNQGEAGCLVEPGNSAAIAQRIVRFLDYPAERFRLGHNARKRLRECYSYSTILPLQEECYKFAINSRSPRFTS